LIPPKDSPVQSQQAKVQSGIGQNVLISTIENVSLWEQNAQAGPQSQARADEATGERLGHRSPFYLIGTFLSNYTLTGCCRRSKSQRKVLSLGQTPRNRVFDLREALNTYVITIFDVSCLHQRPKNPVSERHPNIVKGSENGIERPREHPDRGPSERARRTESLRGYLRRNVVQVKERMADPVNDDSFFPAIRCSISALHGNTA
jgi:hypothetical protein